LNNRKDEPETEEVMKKKNFKLNQEEDDQVKTRPLLRRRDKTRIDEERPRTMTKESGSDFRGEKR
jgi:hypothetical protein